MTTEKQIAANQANARKSTGPVSAKGKVTASKNAQKHGLTTPPDWRHITIWYRIITADPVAVPDPMASGEAKRSALVLAEAEAALERAARAEADHLHVMTGSLLNAGPKSIEERAALDLEDIETLDFLLGQDFDPDKKVLLRLLKRVSPNRPSVQRDTLRRLRRYRREAEARRRKALAAWAESC